MTGFIWLFSAAALFVLFKYKRTSLAVWLMVTIFATLPDLTLSTVMTTVRFTLGWYTARTYALIASFTVLAVMLTETIFLYARLANAVRAVAPRAFKSPYELRCRYCRHGT